MDWVLYVKMSFTMSYINSSKVTLWGLDLYWTMKKGKRAHEYSRFPFGDQGYDFFHTHKESEPQVIRNLYTPKIKLFLKFLL